MRQQLAADLEAANIGSGYSAIVNFAVSPDISSATFYADDADEVVDRSLSTFKLPFRFRFGSDDASTRPFVQGQFSHQTLETDFLLRDDERINSRWRTTGGSLAGGIEIAVSQSLKLLPVVGIGYGSIDNRADYSGPFGQGTLQPIFDNLLFEWDAETFVYGVSLGLDWRREYRDFALEFLANASHRRIRSTSSSSEFVDFEGQASIVDTELNVIRPTSWSIGQYPLALVGLFGATGILGPDRKALGFDKFFEAGLGLEGDLSSRGWKLKTLRLGVKGIFGPDVKGWGFIIGYKF